MRLAIHYSRTALIIIHHPLIELLPAPHIAPQFVVGCDPLGGEL